jgi:hypothetical protein
MLSLPDFPRCVFQDKLIPEPGGDPVKYDEGFHFNTVSLLPQNGKHHDVPLIGKANNRHIPSASFALPSMAPLGRREEAIS